MSRIQELEELRAKKLETRAKAAAAQYELDLETRIALEDEHGTVAAIKCTRFVDGQPTEAYLRTPTALEYKRYKDLVYRAQRDPSAKTSAMAAQEQLARSCWIYPAKEPDQDAMLAAFPGLLTPLGVAAAALAEGKTEEAGKD